jgi:hypothetical protein
MFTHENLQVNSGVDTILTPQIFTAQLTLYSPMVTICTTCVTNQQQHFAQ